MGRVEEAVTIMHVQRPLGAFEDFLPFCRNCGQLEQDHADGKCLFDSTSWEPSSLNEFYTRYRNGRNGSNGHGQGPFLRKK
jgi:hypothetical protein